MTDNLNDQKIQEEKTAENPQTMGETSAPEENQGVRQPDSNTQPASSKNIGKPQEETPESESDEGAAVPARESEPVSEPEPAHERKTKSGSASEAEAEKTPGKKAPEVEAMPVAQKPKTSGANWYVVHTYSGHESKVAATLKQRVESQKLSDKILDILVPTQEKIEIREGKKNTVKEKIFPGYLLVNMLLDDNTWLAVRTTPGITGFIGTANKPTPLPEDEVETIKRFMSMEAPKFKAAFSLGEAVKITDGPFSEFLGSISEIDEEKGKLKVLVSIFGRETPVELDFLQVAKL